MESSKGKQTYEISLTEENKIGEGTYSDVYKIYSKKLQKICAGKFLKVKPGDMSSEDKLGYERELEIMQ